MNYVLRRKLHFAAKRMITYKEKIVDIAYQFGFESHDVFSRAFKRVYGITPESYRKRRYTLHEMKKMVIGNKREGGNEMVDVQVVERPSMCFLGVERRIGNEDGEATIAQVWEHYFQNWLHLFGNITTRVKPEDDAEYALSVFDQDGKLIYFVGFEVEGLESIPTGAVGRKVPSLTYVKATHLGPPAETLGQTLDYVYGEWFENTTYQTAHLRDSPYAVIEYYDKRCSMTPPEMDIYIPITPPPITGLKTYHPLMFCEVFYKLTERDKARMNAGKVETKNYTGGTYAVAPSVHHFLEKDWAAFMRWLEQHEEYSPAGGCFEQFLIENGKVDFYTSLHLYERIVKK